MILVASFLLCCFKERVNRICIDACETNVGGNEYGQCGEEPERKDDTGRPLRRDIVIPQRCAPKLVVRQVILVVPMHGIML